MSVLCRCGVRTDLYKIIKSQSYLFELLKVITDSPDCFQDLSEVTQEGREWIFLAQQNNHTCNQSILIRLVNHDVTSL